jgi:hypothetical protein
MFKVVIQGYTTKDGSVGEVVNLELESGFIILTTIKDDTRIKVIPVPSLVADKVSDAVQVLEDLGKTLV